uniref:catechol O-methyltransferase n=1 Tax=Electrophorus electricus TaxID=8005 RepID=A0AAY5EUV9_ELEEL
MQWTVLALCTGSATGLYVLYSWLLPALQSNACLIYARQTNHKKTIRYHPVCDLMNLLCIPGAQRLLNTVQHKATHGDPESVISDIDHFCKHSEQAMNVGDEKGSILDLVLSEVYPSTALELGTHCGYSGVRIVHLLRPGTRLITVELNPAYASIAQQVIAHAGLQDKVCVCKNLVYMTAVCEVEDGGHSCARNHHLPFHCYLKSSSAEIIF